MPKRVFQPPRLKWLLGFDLVWLPLALFLFYFLLFELKTFPPEYVSGFWLAAAVTIPAYIPVFWVVGLYRPGWRRFSRFEVFRLFLAVFLGFFVHVIGTALLHGESDYFPSFTGFFPAILFIGMLVPRLWVVALHDKKFLTQENRFLHNGLHLLVFSAFAIAQPLFEVMANNVDFFGARQSRPFDLIALVVVYALVFPLFLVGLETLCFLVLRRFYTALHLLLTTALLATIFLPILKKINGVSGAAVISVALAIGVLGTIAYHRFSRARALATWFSPLIIIFPALFLFSPPVSGVFLPTSGKIAFSTGPRPSKGSSQLPPITFVVFDELPLVSLLGADNKIDAARYPNFAALAENSYWFSNATTVSSYTIRAVPSILAGKRFYQDNFRPDFSNVPENLFTLLWRDYDFNVYEGYGKLCPETLCVDYRAQVLVPERIALLIADTFVVYLHVVVPEDYASRLPDISVNWSGFGLGGLVGPADIGHKAALALLRNAQHNPELTFQRFVNSISAGDRPKLNFLHTILPHRPFRFYPSGTRYTEKGTPGRRMPEETWVDRPLFAKMAYQRHLLQVGFTDRLLGKLFAKLRAAGLFDSSLVVVTADHGMSFQAGQKVRKNTRVNYKGIMPVPLFIKLPGQKTGVEVSGNVETIDILPTVAHLLGIKIPWKVDGVVATDPERPERRQKTSRIAGNFEPRIDLGEPVRRKLDLFGSGVNLRKFYGLGAGAHFIGRPLEHLPVRENGRFRIEIDDPDGFRNVKRNSGWSPGHITGRVSNYAGPKKYLDLAVAVNGSVRATTQTFDWAGKKFLFDVVVPESSFQKGANEVEVLLVVPGPDGKLQIIRADNDAGN